MALQLDQIRDNFKSFLQEAGHIAQKGAAATVNAAKNIKPETIEKVALVGLGVLAFVTAPVPTAAGLITGLILAGRLNQNLADIKKFYTDKEVGLWVKVLTVAAAWIVFTATAPALPAFTVGMVCGAKSR